VEAEAEVEAELEAEAEVEVELEVEAEAELEVEAEVEVELRKEAEAALLPHLLSLESLHLAYWRLLCSCFSNCKKDRVLEVMKKEDVSYSFFSR